MNTNRTSESGKPGFTLIELLVVIAIIAILASLLLPALSNAKSQGARTQCVNNQHELAIAIHMYTDDFREYYPIYYDWAAWGGKLGSNNLDLGNGNDPYGLHGGGIQPTNRTLNTYIRNVNLCHCPADKGDPLYGPGTSLNYKGTCWDGWGNSYLMQWYTSQYGVEFVGGSCTLDRTKITANGFPNKVTRVALKPASKIILGDWNWFANRNIASAQTSWHAYKNKRVIPFLFGDGHNEVWTYSPADEKDDLDNAPPNINYRYW